MNIIKNIIEQWKGETPKIAKRFRNICATISVTIPTVWMTFSAMNIALPEIVSQSVGYITLLSLLITGVAGTKETKKARAVRLKKKEL